MQIYCGINKIPWKMSREKNNWELKCSFLEKNNGTLENSRRQRDNNYTRKKCIINFLVLSRNSSLIARATWVILGHVWFWRWHLCTRMVEKNHRRAWDPGDRISGIEHSTVNLPYMHVQNAQIQLIADWQCSGKKKDSRISKSKNSICRMLSTI